MVERFDRVVFALEIDFNRLVIELRREHHVFHAEFPRVRSDNHSQSPSSLKWSLTSFKAASRGMFCSLDMEIASSSLSASLKLKSSCCSSPMSAPIQSACP